MNGRGQGPLEHTRGFLIRKALVCNDVAAADSRRSLVGHAGLIVVGRQVQAHALKIRRVQFLDRPRNPPVEKAARGSDSTPLAPLRESDRA